MDKLKQELVKKIQEAASFIISKSKPDGKEAYEFAYKSRLKAKINPASQILINKINASSSLKESYQAAIRGIATTIAALYDAYGKISPFEDANFYQVINYLNAQKKELEAKLSSM